MSAGNTATPPAAMQRAKRRRRPQLPCQRHPRAAHHHALDPGEVGTRRVCAKPAARSSSRHRAGLAGADLERERSADAGARPRQPADDVEPVRARRTAPSAARGARCRAAARRRSRTYGGFETTASSAPVDRLEQVALEQRDVEPEPLGVGARDGQRVRAGVGGDHLEVGPLGLERQRDRARAGADVGHARARRQLERRLDEVLGLRPRDQHARVDAQLDRAEALACRGCRRPARARAGAPRGPESARLARAERRGRGRRSARARSTPSASASSTSASRRGVSQPAARRAR